MHQVNNIYIYIYQIDTKYKPNNLIWSYSLADIQIIKDSVISNKNPFTLQSAHTHTHTRLNVWTCTPSLCFVFRGVERRRASWEHRCPRVFLWGHFVEFRSWRENCSLCQPSDLRNTFCTPPDICLLHQSLPPMTQTRLYKYTTDLLQTLHLQL